MKLLNIISYRFLWVILIFCAVFLVVFGGVGFAESPGIKITEPADGSTVIPGQQITVTVESVGGFVLKEVLVVTPFSVDTLTSSPFTVVLTIPYEAIGTISVSASGKSPLNEFVEDEITLKIQQTATLQSLEINQDEIFIDLDWDGNIKGDRSGNIVTVYGIYSDGVKRILDDDPGTSYTSSDSSVISVDNKGNFQVYKVGQAAITISNSGVSKVIPVVYLKPRGIKPSETIPPTTKIDIQPPANASGWHNQDITITLTAQDNEGGSGLKEIEYILAGMKGISSKQETVEGDRAEIFISQEGIAKLGYYARDNEWNVESAHLVDLRLDKTPPQVSITTTPNILWPPNNKMVDVTINGQAIDNLSGIDSLTFKVTDEYGKCQPVITGFGSLIKLEASRDGNDKDGRAYTISVTAKDRAGNESLSSTTVTVPHDMGKQGKK